MKTVFANARRYLLYIAAVSILLFAVQSVLAQTPQPTTESPEVKQLKERLKQLEQAVEELKSKITTVEDTQKAAKTVAEDRPVQMMEAVAKDDAVLKPARPGKQDDKKSGTFEVYGFAMLDAGYDFKTNHPDWYDTLRPTKLPSFGGEFAPNGKTYWGVRQSRLGVKSSTATEYGDLKTVFEFELFGTGADAGQTTFRLRHAYGELGRFGAGQYWTVFGDVDAFPNTFEYWGPPGLIWYRNVQVRWMPLREDNLKFYVLQSV